MHKSRKLLSVLLVLVVLPVVLLVLRSAVTMAVQRKMALDFSTRYVRQLARHGATRFDALDGHRVKDFLDLLNDRGYMRVLMRDEPRESRDARDAREERSGKFIPGMMAYIHRDGSLVAGSDRAEILPGLWLRDPKIRESVTGTMDVNGEEMGYSLYAWPTKDPDIVVVAFVSLYNWGGGAFSMGRFVNETMFAALFCLFALILLRRVLIRPLRSLSSGLRTFRWGQEAPTIDSKEGQLFGLQVEEVASLREAVVELAGEAVRKTDLEKRYVGDIVKAQEDERNRLAREIHDGPIQVVAALMQRIQMAALEPGEQNVRKQLALAEEAAQNVVEDLRGICDSLVPPWISLGLARCMEEMGTRLARQHDVTVEVDVDLFVELPQEKTLALFRIFQEGVSNAVRHGRATNIKLSIGQDEATDIVTFRLQDDGIGFDPDAVGMEDLYASGRRGLTGMRQRIESIGGTLKITSEADKGTTVEACFPGSTEDGDTETDTSV